MNAIAVATRLAWRPTSEIRRVEDIVPAFEAFKGRVEALYVCGANPLVNAHRVRINTLALAARLPTMHATRQNVDAGGLMSYGASVADLFRRAGDYVDKTPAGRESGRPPRSSSRPSLISSSI